MESPAPGSWLTPDELLTVRSLLPTAADVSARLDSAFAPIRAWAAANPRLAAREPARTLLERADWEVAEERFRRRPVPLAGTYRVTVWLAGGPHGVNAASRVADSSTFYVRTESHPEGGRGSSQMYVYACAAAEEATLPAALLACRPNAGLFSTGYLTLADTVSTDAAGLRTVPGSIEVAHGDSAFQQRYRRLRIPPINASGEPVRALPGSFTEWPDGRVRFAGTFGPDAMPTVRVVAERVSTVTLRPAPER